MYAVEMMHWGTRFWSVSSSACDIPLMPQQWPPLPWWVRRIRPILTSVTLSPEATILLWVIRFWRWSNRQWWICHTIIFRISISRLGPLTVTLSWVTSPAFAIAHILQLPISITFIVRTSSGPSSWGRPLRSFPFRHFLPRAVIAGRRLPHRRFTPVVRLWLSDVTRPSGPLAIASVGLLESIGLSCPLVSMSRLIRSPCWLTMYIVTRDMCLWGSCRGWFSILIPSISLSSMRIRLSLCRACNIPCLLLCNSRPRIIHGSVLSWCTDGCYPLPVSSLLHPFCTISWN